MKIRGIHHVTSIAGHPQANLDLYSGVLGLRPLKVTVNFDLPQTYHLYYGDHSGAPGTVLTMFPWPTARRPGRPGAGQITATGFAAAPDSLGYWADRLRGQGLAVRGPLRRFDEEVLTVVDRDGLVNEIVARAGTRARAPWQGGPVPGEHALAGFSGVTLHSRQPEATARVLTDLLGLAEIGEEGDRRRFSGDRGQLGAHVDILGDPRAEAGAEGPGTVHHVAFRAGSDEEQRAWQELLRAAGHEVTEVRDRHYFRSIYFREPGGILFEIATDGPGFAVDEPVEALGSRLMLPPQYEARRAELERGLLPITLPSGTRIPA